jgi:uncharacterized membrane protein YphA (DoxX/SURF4 family)
MGLDPALALTAMLLLGVIFVAAAVAKLRAPDRFEGVVRNYRLVPDRLVRPVVYGLPLVELGAAAGLLAAPATRPPAAAVLVLLLLAFAAAMAVNLRRGRHDIDCGCHLGLLKQRISWALVARNLLLAGLGSALIFGEGQARPLGGLDGLAILAASLSLLILYAAVGRLFGLAPAGLKGAR